MKKYRLIEHSPNYNKVVGTWDNDAQAANAMFTYSLANASAMYRIEEMEESIMDRVKSYEDACKVLGVGIIHDNDDVRGIPEEMIEESKHIIALLKLETITAALNEGWKPDFTDDCQMKWAVYYDWEKKSWRTTCYDTSTSVPIRLYFKSQELAEYAGWQFAELYKQLTEIF